MFFSILSDFFLQCVKKIHKIKRQKKEGNHPLSFYRYLILTELTLPATALASSMV